jgi:hypothetical protein
VRRRSLFVLRKSTGRLTAKFQGLRAGIPEFCLFYAFSWEKNKDVAKSCDPIACFSCSTNALGGFLLLTKLEVTICDFKLSSTQAIGKIYGFGVPMKRKNATKKST